MYTPVNPSFTIWKWGLRGSKFSWCGNKSKSHMHARTRVNVWLICQHPCVTQSPLFWVFTIYKTLRNLAYSNILNSSPPKNWKFSDKNSDIFHISAQNIDCGLSLEPSLRGGSNEYPSCMFLSRNNKEEDHDGPISLTWANSFAYLLFKFQPSSLL